jgi:hypothetical protein
MFDIEIKVKYTKENQVLIFKTTFINARQAPLHS